MWLKQVEVSPNRPGRFPEQATVLVEAGRIRNSEDILEQVRLVGVLLFQQKLCG